ncbi:S8 family peptidase [Benzoatithermus flavus]|uniref:S8 family serine peptidase n=1 Tax=Benzoatithermus flavus TaxID=3108223 RepID=A0ABU8XPZ1_9PROT
MAYDAWLRNPGSDPDRCFITDDVEEDGFYIEDFARRDRDDREHRLSRIAREIDRVTSLYGFPPVWRETEGRGIKVAVIDTGIDPDHPAFMPAADCPMAPPRNEGDEPYGPAIVLMRAFREGRLVGEGSDAVRDRNGHGTHCAGIVAARPLRDVPFGGIAPRAQLLIYKVAEDDGSARMSDVALAINDAVDEGADIVSLSLQGERPSDALFAAVHRLLFHRRMIVCAAGNGGQLRPFNIGYPARMGGVITVGATTRMGNPADFSSSGGEIDFCGPGERVWSTWIDRSYRNLSGTSMAAPWVAGISALILAKHRAFKAGPDTGNETPVRNNEDLRDHLLRMAAHPSTHDCRTGYGTLYPAIYFCAGPAGRVG